MDDLLKSKDVPIWKKYSLSIQEAAEYYGIGEKRIRQIASENPNADFILEVGSHIRIKREKYFQHVVEKYNSIYKVQLPKITPHVCRHTFCSNMAKSGMNPKTLQYIMGHADIGVTLNTYTHLSFEDAREEMTRLCANE